jgi:uncharacterized membrane protein YhiD involved in acid resistance
MDILRVVAVVVHDVGHLAFGCIAQSSFMQDGQALGKPSAGSHWYSAIMEALGALMGRGQVLF